jgi:hypothetical protein
MISRLEVAMSGDKGASDETTVWVPVCCSLIMRHSVFGSAEGKSVAAALVCSSCGRHILLQPQPTSAVHDLSGRVISLLATTKSRKIESLEGGVESADGEMGEETLA